MAVRDDNSVPTCQLCFVGLLAREAGLLGRAGVTGRAALEHDDCLVAGLEHVQVPGDVLGAGERFGVRAPVPAVHDRTAERQVVEERRSPATACDDVCRILAGMRTGGDLE